MNANELMELAKEGMDVHSDMHNCPEYIICQAFLQLQAENVLLRNQVEPLRKELIELHKENEALKEKIKWVEGKELLKNE